MVKQLTILGAWCLLAAALSDPAWAIAHAVHHVEHEAHSAASAPAPEGVERGEHEHRHADRFLALQSRSVETGNKYFTCTDVLSPELPTALRIPTQSEVAPCRASTGPVSCSAPRGPPFPLA